jgi:hypothetical protein
MREAGRGGGVEGKSMSSPFFDLPADRAAGLCL